MTDRPVRLRRSEPVFTRRGPDLVVVASPAADAVVLEGPAVDVWDVCDDWVEFDVVAEQLAERFGAEVSHIAPDVQVVVDRLVALGLMVVE